MRRMTDFERKLYNKVEHNSLLFLEEGVKKLMEGNCQVDITDAMVLACTNIQISLELAMRAYILKNKGLEYIIDKKQKEKNTDEEIEKLYAENRLKVIEFETMKNQLKEKDASVFKKEDFQIIDEFQIYRNKLVHFCCQLEKDETRKMRERLMYYVVRVVLCLLYDNYDDKRPAEYFEEILGWDFFRILNNDQGYIRAIEQLAKERADEIGRCPICFKKAYSVDEELCYFCNIQPQNGEWGRTDCLECGKKNMVIYDRLNIHVKGNQHSISGMCQNCDSRPEIFECPKCGQTYWMYSDTYDWMCYDGHCTTYDQDYVD